MCMYRWSVWSLSNALGNKGEDVSRWYTKRLATWADACQKHLPARHYRHPLPSNGSREQAGPLVDGALLPFASFSTHGLFLLGMRSLALSPSLGGLKDGPHKTQFRQVLDDMLALVADDDHRQVQIFAEPVWHPPRSPGGAGSCVSLSRHGRKIDTSPLPVVAEALGRQPDVLDLMVWSYTQCFMLFLQVMWNVAGAVEVNFSASLKAEEERPVKRRRGSAPLATAKVADDDRNHHYDEKITPEEMQRYVSGRLLAFKSAANHDFELSGALSMCCDFGRVLASNKMITIMAVPSGVADWAPQMDLLHNVTPSLTNRFHNMRSAHTIYIAPSG